PLLDVHKRGVQYHSFARWMDDMWLFVHDPGQARRAQVELQRAAQTVGLNLNAAKTEVLEEGTAVTEVRDIEHSAVDLALLLGKNDHGPLEALLDRIIDAPEKTGRTSIKFAAVRMRDHGCRHRVMELINASKRMPHAADSLAPLFKMAFTSASLQDWFLEYANENWAAFEWSTAQYARMFDSGVIPNRNIIEYFEKLVQNAGTSLPLLAVTSQRLAEWKPASARAVIRAAVRNASNPHARRVLALSARNAGEPRRVVKAWLEGHDANRVTLAMLESRSYRPVSVVENYRK
ncbi:MAG: hypothetical protein LC749_06780, partial [Actinobacteria bacterium]|nr:hypothetical protein [Actinomycetota bacterium]